MLYEPGFSTSPIITDLSGRGVGMEIVKTNGGMDQVHLAFTRETVPQIHIADGYILVAVPEDDDGTDHVE